MFQIHVSSWNVLQGGVVLYINMVAVRKKVMEINYIQDKMEIFCSIDLKNHNQR